jgi:hypothetical protein
VAVLRTCSCRSLIRGNIHSRKLQTVLVQQSVQKLKPGQWLCSNQHLAEEGRECLYNMFFRLRILTNSVKIPVFMAEVQDNPTFQMADINLKFTKPELQIHINSDKANLTGCLNTEYRANSAVALSGQRFGYFL